jgi:hypothetical protein
LLAERFGTELTDKQQNGPRKPEVEALRSQIQQGLAATSSSAGEPDKPAESKSQD